MMTHHNIRGILSLSNEHSSYGIGAVSVARSTTALPKSALCFPIPSISYKLTPLTEKTESSLRINAILLSAQNEANIVDAFKVP